MQWVDQQDVLAFGKMNRELVKNADGPSEETVRNSTTLKTQRQHKLKC
jgi:hypothetical protein